MRRALAILLLAPLLLLSGCQPGSRFGIYSGGDIREYADQAFPLAVGEYRLAGTDDAEITFFLRRDAEGYWVPETLDPAASSRAHRLYMFPLSQFGDSAEKNTYIVQLAGPEPEDNVAYSYYLATVSADVVTVMTPSPSDLAALPDTLKDVVKVDYETDLFVPNPADLVTVFREIAHGGIGLEPLWQLTPVT